MKVHCDICTVMTIFLTFEEKAMKASHCNDGTTIALKVRVSNLTTWEEKEMEIDF